MLSYDFCVILGAKIYLVTINTIQISFIGYNVFITKQLNITLFTISPSKWEIRFLLNILYLIEP